MYPLADEYRAQPILIVYALIYRAACTFLVFAAWCCLFGPLRRINGRVIGDVSHREGRGVVTGNNFLSMAKPCDDRGARQSDGGIDDLSSCDL